MQKAVKIIFVGLLVLMGTGQLFSQNRYALVIGNGNYRSREISALTNPANDATDVAAVLRELGYNVTLKTNVGLRDMMGAVQDFSLNLKRSNDNEGFFWFAGHGLSVRGLHYLLPVDVDPVNDNIIARGSYSVDDLMEEIGNARNRTNLIVIDACRNTLLPGQTRSVGSRGLTVLAADDYRVAGNKIVYSTMAGRTASDGDPGSRNSPFAQAFISNIKNPESFDDVFLDIANETLRLTRGDQHPYSMGTFAVKSYSINPAPAAAPAANVPANAAAQVTPIQPAQPSWTYQEQKAPLSLDGKRVMNLSVAPVLSSFTFASNQGAGPGVGVYAGFSFYESYLDYGTTFFIPNSFFASLEFAEAAQKFRSLAQASKTNEDWDNLQQEWHGLIWSVGAQYKIRLGEQQRFVTNFGLCLSVFTIFDSALYEFSASNNSDTSYLFGSYESYFVPGFGLLGGMSFRFTRLISMDLGISWKMGFSGKDYKYGAEILAKGIYPYHIGGRLGVSFWFER